MKFLWDNDHVKIDPLMRRIYGHDETLSDEHITLNLLGFRDDDMLDWLPDNMTFRNYLILQHLPNLKKLPENLTVGANLFLDRLPITELPISLKVGHNLYFEYLFKLREIPKEIEVGGGTILYRNTSTYPMKRMINHTQYTLKEW